MQPKNLNTSGARTESIDLILYVFQKYTSDYTVPSSLVEASWKCIFCCLGGDAEVLIPSVFIGKSDAEKILDHYTYKVRNSHVVFYSSVSSEMEIDFL